MEHIFGGIGLLPVEALLCNTPVIGGSLENFPDDCRELVGFAVTDKYNVKKAILNIIDQKVSFSNLRQIARKNYSWEKIINDTKEDFTKLIASYYE